MRIALASDHAGFAEKERLKGVFEALGVEFDDLGTVSEESVDYPDYARKVAEQVAQGKVEQGVLVCGSGTGMAITANKVPGVRAAVAWSEETARLARQHNDANVLAMARALRRPTISRRSCAPGLMRSFRVAGMPRASRRFLKWKEADKELNGQKLITRRS